LLAHGIPLALCALGLNQRTTKKYTPGQWIATGVARVKGVIEGKLRRNHVHLMRNWFVNVDQGGAENTSLSLGYYKRGGA